MFFDYAKINVKAGDGGNALPFAGRSMFPQVAPAVVTVGVVEM